VTTAAPSTPLEERRRVPVLDPEPEGLIEETRERVQGRAEWRDRTASYVVGGAFLCAAVAVLELLPQGRHVSPLAIALGVAVYALVSRVEFEIGRGAAIPTQLALVPMLFILPLNAVPLCVALALLLRTPGDLLRGTVRGERVFIRFLSSWHAVGPVLVLAAAHAYRPSWSHWPIYVAALAAQFALDFASSSLREWLAFGASARSRLGYMGWVWGVDVALAPIGLVVAFASAHSPWVMASVLPVTGLLAVFARERQRRIDQALELGHAYRGTAFLLGDVVEADDAYTGGHSREVVDLVLAVSARLGLSPRDRRDAEFAALLHDVGKIRIPKEIINKPGSLTPEEWEVMRTHTTEGERLLAKVGGLLGQVGTIVRSCHERWDGGGYPDGLAGEQIPLVARIVMCCDALNAMTTDRSYRKAFPLVDALAELRRNAGSQFDPAVVEALVAVVAEGEVG
jgi:HD-GYP domain-containing protein (c-di-GMP phosphodiesterase class II)